MSQGKSGWDPGWTQAGSPITQKVIDEIGKTLIHLIESSPDKEWVGTYDDIMAACGLVNSDYGTYYNAMPHVRKKFNIISDKLGRKGNRYYFGDDSDQLKVNFTQTDKMTTPNIHITISVDFPNQPQQTYSFTINPVGN